MVAWVLRAYPFVERAGQHLWLASLLESTAASGCTNHVLVPDGTGLAVRLRVPSCVASLRSPLLRSAGPGRHVGTAPLALRRAAWAVYLAAPAPIQRAVASLRRANRRRRGVDHVLGRAWTPQETTWIGEQLADLAPEVVVFDSVFADTGSPDRAARVVLAHDVVSSRAESLAALGYRTAPSDIDRGWEGDRLGKFDLVVAIQWDDAETLTTLAPTIPVVVAPPAFPRPSTPSAGASPRVPGRCLVVGSGALHNVDGLQWLLDEVWPQVRDRVAGASMRVAGTVGTQLRTTPSSEVELLGQVADLTSEYATADVVLVALRAGSGLKVKLAEAVVRGCAVVTTSVGAQGLGALDPAPFAVADGADGFADAVVSLLGDPVASERLRAAAVAAAPMFHLPAAHAGLDLALRRLAGSGRPEG